jgi:hypothetical protein
MSEGLSYEEAKRVREQQLREERARQQPPPLEEPPPYTNGHDKSGRNLERVDWNKLGAVVEQDNLVSGLLGPQQFGMVYGESGSGKSFMTFDMFAHYALRLPWMGRKVKGGGVLYIAAEGRGGWPNRVEAFYRHHQIDDEQRVMAPFQFILESINLGKSGGADAAAVVRAAEGFMKEKDTSLDAIVVDTMARATPGSNENDAGDMGAFVANMDLIRRNTGASPVVVHHSGKNSNLGARGHSSLRAAMDMEAEVERNDAGRVLRLRKSRDGGDSDEIAFDLQVVEVGTGLDGKPITSCVVVPRDLQDGEGKAKRSADKAMWELALPYLSNALIDAPANVPRNGKFPTHVPITTVEHFREALVRASIIDGETAATRRVQWKRVKDKLIAKGLMVIEQDYCWRVDA